MMKKTGASPARFIVFEGIDGSGKSTHAKELSKTLSGLGIKSVCQSEPTDGMIGRLIRDILSGSQKADSKSVAALFAADRLEHIAATGGILQNLNDGISVISDRYYFSSYAYQMADMPLEWVMELNSQAKKLAKPDIHIFIDVPPKDCIERINVRGANLDIYENLSRLTATRENFFKIFKAAGDENVVIIDGRDDFEVVSVQVLKAVSELF